MTIIQFLEDLKAQVLPLPGDHSILISNLDWLILREKATKAMPSHHLNWKAVVRDMPKEVWVRYQGDEELRRVLREWLS